ncbi:MAG: phosphotransferase, partial [Aquihabitans sp.]
ADGQRDTRSAVAAPDVEHPVAALVTPRYAASRTVVGLATDETGRQITRIAKLARSVAHQTTLIEESRMLDAFLARSIDRHHVPTGHHLALNAGCVALVENAVDGYPLDRRAVRRNPSGALRAGLAWLEQVPTSDSVEPFDGERFDELIGRPLAAIEAALPGSSGEDPSSSRAGELLSTLRGMALPVVFEHGDLSHPNLFVDPADDLVVIDWEQARPDGLPLHDAFYFIAYLAESVDRPDDDDSLIASYREAFSCSGWARPDIDLHLERLGIDPRQVPLLNLACWTRMLAQALGSPPTARTRHRADRMWRAAIEDAERCAR